ncbi:MAG: hypothetical protein JWQ16_118 [Novosphingobium sp.]|nr:hypothetical protein [Novosphingobium sp.]
MPPEIVALIDKPLLLALVLAVGAVCGMAVERIGEKWNRAERRAFWKKRNGEKNRAAGNRGFGQLKTVTPKGPPERQALDAADQLRLVMEAEFTPRPLLNKSEARLFRALDKMVIARNPEWQVMAQVSVGEFVGSADADAYACINSKRVDLLLVDGDCRARHAIEYQGTGHHQGTAAARDAVKKEALRKAGVGYDEVVAGKTTPSDLQRLVEKVVPAIQRGAGAPRSRPLVLRSSSIAGQ